MTGAIDSVIFDIGWVLVRMNYPPLLQFLRQRGVAAPTLHAALEHHGLTEHESGRLHGEQFLGRLREAMREPAALAELHGHWTGMFELDTQMVELAQRVSASQRVYLLSNIGDLHWAHLARAYSLHTIGHGAVLSYVVGVMKPHAGIYAETERRFGLTPQRTVFIDDRADNIDSARARGWHGIVHRDYPSTCAALRALAVQC